MVCQKTDTDRLADLNFLTGRFQCTSFLIDSKRYNRIGVLIGHDTKMAFNFATG